MVEDVRILKPVHIDCDACALGKLHTDKFPVNTDRRRRDILEIVHTNLCGPMHIRSLGGSYYILLFIDECTIFTWVYFLRNKSQTLKYFKEFRSMVEKHTGKSMRILPSDQGGEYKKSCVLKYCKDNGIQQQFTVLHTPQQNGVVERKNRTLVECARSMLKGKNLSNGFWAEAIHTRVYLKNSIPSRILYFKTPFEALFVYKPGVKNLRVFGSKDFAHDPKEDRKKLNSKVIKGIFVGYCTEFKA